MNPYESPRALTSADQTPTRPCGLKLTRGLLFGAAITTASAFLLNPVTELVWLVLYGEWSGRPLTAFLLAPLTATILIWGILAVPALVATKYIELRGRTMLFCGTTGVILLWILLAIYLCVFFFWMQPEPGSPESIRFQYLTPRGIAYAPTTSFIVFVVPAVMGITAFTRWADRMRKQVQKEGLSEMPPPEDA